MSEKQLGKLIDNPYLSNHIILMANEEINEEQMDNSAEKEVVAETSEKAPELTELEKATAEAADWKDKYVRLYAEFDNYKRRTSKERIDLLKTANEDLMSSLIPVIDDFDRALKNIPATEDTKALREGVELIHNKFNKTLTQKGLTPMNAQGEVFNSELHEAITQIPAPTEDLKGKVVDEVEKGYYLGDKVIRYAKVVIGA
ncbi:molecular chaperone GrpE [Cytophaga hutchinsonii ATCC 33406]|nr:molecular chaperone GrpE [Cytophaga hutchinsonii ATCC 33406]